MNIKKYNPDESRCHFIRQGCPSRRKPKYRLFYKFSEYLEADAPTMSFVVCEVCFRKEMKLVESMPALIYDIEEVL